MDEVTEIRDQRSEVNGQKSEVGSQRSALTSDLRSPISDPPPPTSDLRSFDRDAAVLIRGCEMGLHTLERRIDQINDAMADIRRCDPVLREPRKETESLRVLRELRREAYRGVFVLSEHRQVLIELREQS